MTLQNKILSLNTCLTAAVITAFAFATDTFPGNGFFLMLAFITIAGGAGAVILGLLLLLKKDKRMAKAYFISALFLLLIGSASYFFLQHY